MAVHSSSSSTDIVEETTLGATDRASSALLCLDICDFWSAANLRWICEFLDKREACDFIEYWDFKSLKSSGPPALESKSF